MTADREAPAEWRSCPSKGTAVLGLPSPVDLPCVLRAGHGPNHEYWLRWTDDMPPVAPVPESQDAREALAEKIEAHDVVMLVRGAAWMPRSHAAAIVRGSDGLARALAAAVVSVQAPDRRLRERIEALCQEADEEPLYLDNYYGRAQYVSLVEAAALRAALVSPLDEADTRPPYMPHTTESARQLDEFYRHHPEGTT